MSDFAPLQRKQTRKTLLSPSSSPVLPSAHALTPATTAPVPTSVGAPDRQAEMVQAERFGHSISRFAIQRSDAMTGEEGPTSASLGHQVSVASELLRPQQNIQAADETEANRPRQDNRIGLPASLKAGLERLSGYSLSDVRVHYDSSEPAEVDALAYTQGTEIHVGPGQQQYLPHEAWHVVQQKQGRVHPTRDLNGKSLNEDQGLEREADATAQQVAAGHIPGVVLTQGPVGREIEHAVSVQASGSAAPSATIQRVKRKGLSMETTPLSPDQELLQKGVFTEEKGEQGIPVTVDEKHAKKLFAQIKKAADKYLAEMKRERTPTGQPAKSTGAQAKKAKTAKISPNDYNALVTLAIKQVKASYNIQLQEAHEEANMTLPSSVFAASEFGGGPVIGRAEPDKRWDTVLQAKNQERLKDEAVACARYILDVADSFHDPAQKTFDGIVASYQKKNSKITQADVQEAYLDELTENPQYQSYILPFAEVRLKWDPKTEDATVYLAQFSDSFLNKIPEDVTVEIAWDKFKRVVHEIVHTAAHRKFEEYVHQNEEYGNTILEGTVDYFALKVWKQISLQLQSTSPEREVVTTVQAISRASLPDSLSQTAKTALEGLEGRPLYSNEVAIIEKAIGTIPDGEERLKAAFFYGDVEHFFPQF